MTGGRRRSRPQSRPRPRPRPRYPSRQHTPCLPVHPPLSHHLSPSPSRLPPPPSHPSSRFSDASATPPLHLLLPRHIIFEECCVLREQKKIPTPTPTPWLSPLPHTQSISSTLASSSTPIPSLQAACLSDAYPAHPFPLTAAHISVCGEQKERPPRPHPHPHPHPHAIHTHTHTRIHTHNPTTTPTPTPTHNPTPTYKPTPTHARGVACRELNSSPPKPILPVQPDMHHI
mmetsp:Transcript_42714/g.107827  ORF Transcript_42714/g.107827 Transcript_42714/m.107827 type:complete len:230 (+) Transcript_42714:270-959(+)